MDATNTIYRIRQCSKCPEDLKYFCATCSSDLCLQCGENHKTKNLNKDINNVIMYREKSKYLKKHEICLRHPNNVYTKYCELCNIPICTDCTDHRNHRQTDVGTVYKAKRKNKEIIQNIRSQELPIHVAFLAHFDLHYKAVFSDLFHLKSNILRNSKKLTGCLDNVLHNFHLEHRCLKQKIKINKYIASTCIYEHEYVKSSDAPIKFLLSVKKHPRLSKTFKYHGQITLTSCKSKETVIEELLTINFTNKGKCLTETEKINRRMIAQLTMMLRAHQSKESLPAVDLVSKFGLGYL